MDDKIAILEAALFLSADPLSVEQLASVMGVGSIGYVRTVLDKYREVLASDNRGLELFETDSKFELKVKRSLTDKVAHLAPHQDIAPGTLRTLSLIAYENPIEQSKVIDIRGNRAYEHVKELEERGFVEGNKQGRTKILSITQNFLKYFGLETPEEFKMHVERGTKK